MKRYALMGGALGGLLVLVVMLMPRPQGVDILISLKEVNQRIAPAALSCPEWSYPEGATVTCTLESATDYSDVEMIIGSDGIKFLDERAAQEAIDGLLDE
jgi:hypothetical protein